MKIYHLISYYYPCTGGQETVAKELTERFANRGYKVEVFTSNFGSTKSTLKLKNIKINYLKSFKFANTPILFSLPYHLLKIQKDSIIHVHIPRAFIPEITYLIHKVRKIPYVVHFHGDLYPSGKFGFLLPLYNKIILKNVLKGASKVICLTEGYKKLVHKEYNIPKNNIVVLPNGINKSFFINKRKNKKYVTQLLYVGRLSADKNIDKLINAVGLLKHKVIFNVVGNGEKESELKQLISDKKLNNVILHGKKNGSKLINFYKTASIFLLASNSEGLPLVLLEAMASGVPIIASNIPGTRNIIKNSYNGLLVKPTPEEIAKAIEKLIKNSKLREKLAKNGLYEVKKYSWDKIVEQIEEIYMEVLNEYNNK